MYIIDENGQIKYLPDDYIKKSHIQTFTITYKQDIDKYDELIYLKIHDPFLFEKRSNELQLQLQLQQQTNIYYTINNTSIFNKRFYEYYKKNINDNINIDFSISDYIDKISTKYMFTYYNYNYNNNTDLCIRICCNKLNIDNIKKDLQILYDCRIPSLKDIIIYRLNNDYEFLKIVFINSLDTKLSNIIQDLL